MFISQAIFLLIENALEGKIWLHQIWFVLQTMPKLVPILAINAASDISKGYTMKGQRISGL
jgi:hypothetical protein